MHAVQKLLFVTTLTAVLAGCSDSSAPGSAPTAAAPAASTAAPATAAPAAVVASSDSVVTGIPECDQFLSAYEQCIAEKVPAEAREAMKSGIGQWKTAWRDMANNAATKGSLPQMCQQARDSTKPALQAYGCTL